jgi:hypothetical protein
MSYTISDVKKKKKNQDVYVNLEGERTIWLVIHGYNMNFETMTTIV